MAPTKIVVVGGSYAGIAVINQLLASKANQKQEIEITLIERQVLFTRFLKSALYDVVIMTIGAYILTTSYYRFSLHLQM